MLRPYFESVTSYDPFLTNVSVATGFTRPLTTKWRVAARVVGFFGLVSRSGALYVLPSSPPESYAGSVRVRRATHAPFSIRFTSDAPVNQSGLGATMLTTETSGCAGSTRTVATIESRQFLSPPDSNSIRAWP